MPFLDRHAAMRLAMTKGEKTAPCDDGEGMSRRALSKRLCEEAKPTTQSSRVLSLTVSLPAARRDGEGMTSCVCEFERQMQLGKEGMAAYRNTLHALAK